MNKNIAISIVAIIIIAAGVYFLFIRNIQTSAPVNNQHTPTPVASQPAQTGPVVCTDQNCLYTNFLQCNPVEFKMPFVNNSTYTITVLGIENGNCNYKFAVKDATGTAAGGIIECNVPKAMITQDTFGHFFGQDKAPGKESVLAAQTKLQTDYCKTVAQ